MLSMMWVDRDRANAKDRLRLILTRLILTRLLAALVLVAGTIGGAAPVHAQVGAPGAVSHELTARLGVFLGVFALLALAETLRPRRLRHFTRARRWAAHFGVLMLATLLARLVAVALPVVGATVAAIYAAQAGWGLFNAVAWPIWLEIVLAVVLLDLAIWAQHVMTHRVPPLWRIHRVHHSDRDLDASSALRFHPFEMMFSAFYKLIAILALGPAVLAVIAFEIILNASAMFNHANLALPERVDRWLRRVIVTPDMHRVHHSVVQNEHNRNFGFCLSIWDRLFGTYLAAPAAGQEGMTIGLPEWQAGSSPARFGWLMALPFRSSAAQDQTGLP